MLFGIDLQVTAFSISRHGIMITTSRWGSTAILLASIDVSESMNLYHVLYTHDHVAAGKGLVRGVEDEDFAQDRW